MNKKVENIAAIILLLVVVFLGAKTFFLDSSVELPFLKTKKPVVNSAVKKPQNETNLPSTQFDDKVYEKIKAKDHYESTVAPLTGFRQSDNPFGY